MTCNEQGTNPHGINSKHIVQTCEDIRAITSQITQVIMRVKKNTHA